MSKWKKTQFYQIYLYCSSDLQARRNNW
jgi:hypothetical protein